MQFADDLSLLSSEHLDLQTMLNELSIRWEEVSHCQHTEVRGNSNSENLLPLYFDGVMLPYMGSFKYLGMVCDKQINLITAADAALRPFTAGTFRVCSET